MAIDEKRIIDAVLSMNPQGNEEGIIDAFGVYLTNHYADYYNRISYIFERELERSGGQILKDVTKPMLIEAGHVCGFNTFGGIYKSDFFRSAIGPMCDSKEDCVKALVAVINALGWGTWEVESVTHDQLVVRIKNTYESTGFLKEFGKSSSSECFLATGVAAALMNIVFQDNVYEDMNANKFVAEEVKCKSKGDAYCEFVAKRKNS